MSRTQEISPETVPAEPASQPTGTLAARAPDRLRAIANRRHAPLAAMLSGSRWRRTARCLGLGIFLLGAALLAYVFVKALFGFEYFSEPGHLNSELLRVSGDGAAGAITGGIAVFGSALMRLLYLLLLGYLASAIAAKGIQFFSASEAIIDEAVVGSYDDDMMD